MTKRFVILICSFSFFLSCYKDIVEPTECMFPERDYEMSIPCIASVDSVAFNYFINDATLLAYQDIASDLNHSGYNETGLDSETVTYYLSKLSAIYQAALLDTGSLHAMIFHYDVHQLPNPILNFLGIKFIDSSVLRYELLNTPGNTSNDFLNELFTEYEFNDIHEGGSNSVNMSGVQNINVSHVKRQLELVEEIESIHFNFYLGEGSTISCERFVGYDVFIFSHCFSLWPLSCNGRYNWEIKVEDNCNVILLDEYFE